MSKKSAADHMMPGNGFIAREDGSMTVLALFLFVCMVIIGGISIDIMLYENNRTRLQNLSDRAALAAADLDQSVSAAEIVASYFEREGLDPYLQQVRVNEGVNRRSVVVETERVQRTMFLNFWNHSGVDTLTSRPLSAASEARTDLEISLVLDVSNSMNWASGAAGSTSKLADMKNAANRFVDTIYNTDSPERITMNLVPYSTHVNAGESVADALNVERTHDASFCLEFADADYGETRIRAEGRYGQGAHFDQWYYDPTPQLHVCRPDSETVIRPVQSDPDAIKDYINRMTANGNTSTEIGLKWGAALLDPSARRLTRRLILDGVVAEGLEDRPFAWDRDNTSKYVVILTDGVNTQQMSMNDSHAAGPSDVWRWTPSPLVPARFYSRAAAEIGDEDGDGIANERYFTPGFTIPGPVSGLGYDVQIAKGWTMAPVGQNLSELAVSHWNPATRTARRAALIGALGATNPKPVRLDYVALWNEMPVRHLAWYYIRGMRNSDTAMNAFLTAAWTATEGPAKDARLLDQCDTLRRRGATVFTIGFEVNDHAADIMGRCASNANYFIRVAGNDLEAAFDQIANSISKLRLTQ